MENITIRYLDHPKLEDPTFIEGLPGIGNVGKLAAEHLKDELKAVKFAEIFSKYFPPQVLVQDDGQVKLVNNEMHFVRSEEHTSELQSHSDLVCRLLLEKKKNKKKT